jgi:hypothetical protein
MPNFAVVHLTYSTESNPHWPSTKLFDTLEKWIAEGLERDADEFDA